MKSILFNTEMVRAILDGRKTVTRRAVQPPALYGIVEDEKGRCIGSWYEDEHVGYCYPTVDDCPYQPGDVLYVRETWLPFDKDHIIDGRRYAYRADCTPVSEQIRTEYNYKWRPSIHMPKEAARLFLRVTDIRVERLQDMKIEDFLAEGIPGEEWDIETKNRFIKLWDSTIKKADLDKYGWAANPFVWVIAFEKISREEALKNA